MWCGCRYSDVRTCRYNSAWEACDGEQSFRPRVLLQPQRDVRARGKGETIEITRHGKVVATLIPGQQKKRSRIEELEASGALRRSGKTTSDLATFTHIELPEGAPDPLQTLLEDRYSESDWELEFREELEARGNGKP